MMAGLFVRDQRAIARSDVAPAPFSSAMTGARSAALADAIAAVAVLPADAVATFFVAARVYGKTPPKIGFAALGKITVFRALAIVRKKW